MLRRVICVRTGDKYDEWYVDNLKFMIDNHTDLMYDEFHVVRNDVHDIAVYNKLEIFKEFRDGQNIYFDLDLVMKGSISQFWKENLTVLHAHWRKNGDYYNKGNPINSSVMSWVGDFSHIAERVDDQPDYYYLKYSRGMDEYLWKEWKPDLYEDSGYTSFQVDEEWKDEQPVLLFNQRGPFMNPSLDFPHCKFLLPRQ